MGQASITCRRFPEWSRSSWDKNTQRTSSGSTSPQAAASHSSRLAGAPVSIRVGSAPRMTMEFIGKKPTGGAGRFQGMTNVSSAIW